MSLDEPDEEDDLEPSELRSLRGREKRVGPGTSLIIRIYKNNTKKIILR